MSSPRGRMLNRIKLVSKCQVAFPPEPAFLNVNKRKMASYNFI